MTSGFILVALRLALALALYGFLGWALFTLWSDLKRQAHILVIQKPPRITLLRKAGEELHPYVFEYPEVIIGRDPACDLILEDSTVSSRHARLSYHQGHWWLEDLHSTNGTLLNGEPVATPVVLTSGDRLNCGQTSFSIDLVLSQHNGDG
jgi:pSer/pThr/pTyr-binding forkhead associated (FHA) protein